MEYSQQAEKRFKDLRKLTIGLVEDVIEWNTYLNYVGKLTGKSFIFHQYFSDASNRNVLEDFSLDMAELANLKIFSGVIFSQKDYFLVKRLNPSLSPRLRIKVPLASEEEVSRAKAW